MKNRSAKTIERYRKVLTLRASGRTWREIAALISERRSEETGAVIPLSKQAVQQLVARAVQWQLDVMASKGQS